MRKSSNKTNSSRKSTRSKNNATNTSLDNMKYEIANEFGVTLGGKASSEANGKVGGEMTKRLVSRGRNK
ncbi:MAG: alpha/beta-type small acid-soluble spore protein [Bacilli bacterium]|nr:alpha/beta-type small acid-soluble spore protein [Bacilli bacterium]